MIARELYWMWINRWAKKAGHELYPMDVELEGFFKPVGGRMVVEIQIKKMKWLEDYMNTLSDFQYRRCWGEINGGSSRRALICPDAPYVEGTYCMGNIKGVIRAFSHIWDVQSFFYGVDFDKKFVLERCDSDRGPDARLFLGNRFDGRLITRDLENQFQNLIDDIQAHKQLQSETKLESQIIDLKELNRSLEQSIFERGKTYTVEQKPKKLYLMKDKANGLYKIGISVNPKYRECTLQSRKPSIELVGHWEDLSDKEKHWHDYFVDQRQRGEWFDLTAAQVRFFCSQCNKGFGPPDPVVLELCNN